MAKRLEQVSFFIIFFLIWEGIVYLEIYTSNLMPSWRVIINAFFLQRLDLFYAVITSLLWIFLSLLMAFVIGILGVAIGQRHSIFHTWLHTLVQMAHPIPGVALLPLVILWFGIGQEALMFILIHAALWPMVINLDLEIVRIKKQYTKVIKAYNITFKDKFIKIYGLGSLPAIISAMRIGWSRAWRAFISAEMIFGIIGSKSGIGWFIFEKRVYSDIPGLYAGILAIVLCSMAVEYLIFNPLEKLTIKKWAI
jgi:NitT/TauT family transport system permease protein